MALNYHKGATYTVEVGSLVENGFDLGLADYPIFDEAYRQTLNNKIIEHYWWREIGQETPQAFKMMLNRTMAEIMPYYNQLYESTLLDVALWANVNVTTTGERRSLHGEERATDRTDTYSGVRTESSTVESSASSDTSGRTLSSNTPQMQLAGHEDYASSLVDTTSTGANTSSSDTDGKSADNSTTSVDGRDTMSANDTQDYSEKVLGVQGITGAQAIQQMRDAILNVDMMVIYALEPLFMQLWGPIDLY